MNRMIIIIITIAGFLNAEENLQLDFPAFEEFTLDNGVKVLIAEHHEQPAAFFNCAAGLNFKTLDALILIASPVCGLRPLRAFRFEIVKEPNVPTVNLPSFFEAFRPASISPKTRATVRPAAAFESLPFFATRSINAALLISMFSLMPEVGDLPPVSEPLGIDKRS